MKDEEAERPSVRNATEDWVRDAAILYWSRDPNVKELLVSDIA